MNKMEKLENEIHSKMKRLKEDMIKSDISIPIVAKLHRLINYRLSILNEVLEMISEIMEEDKNDKN